MLSFAGETDVRESQMGNDMLPPPHHYDELIFSTRLPSTATMHFTRIHATDLF